MRERPPAAEIVRFKYQGVDGQHPTNGISIQLETGDSVGKVTRYDPDLRQVAINIGSAQEVAGVTRIARLVPIGNPSGEQEHRAPCPQPLTEAPPRADPKHRPW